MRSLHAALLARREQIGFYTCGVPGRFDWPGLIMLPCVLWLAFVADRDYLILGIGGLALGRLALHLWPFRYEPDDIPRSFLPREPPGVSGPPALR